MIILFLVLAVIWGPFGGRAGPAYQSWSPLGFYLLFLLVLFLTGHLPHA